MFHLTVTDSEGNSSSDSVSIRSCTFYMSSHMDVNIQKGDSAHIFASVSTDCPAATYKWSPDYNISDINSENPIVWPDSSLIYSVEISYYAGCVYYDVCQVNVSPANSVNDLSGQIDIEVYPNPLSDELFIIFNKPLMLSKHHIYIYDSTGKVTLIYYFTQNKNHYQIDLSALMPGIYYYKIKNDKTNIKTGLFLNSIWLRPNEISNLCIPCLPETPGANRSSCGLNGNGYGYPASYENVISVTSIGQDNRYWDDTYGSGSRHTHNDNVDICAPE